MFEMSDHSLADFRKVFSSIYSVSQIYVKCKENMKIQKKTPIELFSTKISV